MSAAEAEAKASRVREEVAAPAATAAADAAPKGVAAGRAPADFTGVKSGEWDDNANYRDFVGYLKSAPRSHDLDVSKRLVEYKDRRDVYVTRRTPFTSDVRSFLSTLRNVSASGGGDLPEDMNEENYRSGDLHQLVSNKVYAAISAVDRDPTRIAGLGKDEQAKPCAERVEQVVWTPKGR